MPKEKTLLIIGIWIILLSNFIGLPTEIKNYLFIATGLILVGISYASNFSKKDTQENFFHTHEKPVQKTEVKQEKRRVRDREPLIVSMKKTTSIEETSSSNLSVAPTENPFQDIDHARYVEQAIKVRKSRSKPKPKLVRESESAEETMYKPVSTAESFEDDEDVIVISSDGDNGQGV